MFANPAASKLDESQDSFAATSATRLPQLQLRSTLIAKHCFSYECGAAQVQLILNWVYECQP
jgi:hypothetical protein